MSDTEYDGECYRKSADYIEVRRYDGGKPATGECGQTRQAGILAVDKTNERAASQATFKGRENIRNYKRG